jgi:hypothetical protein
VRDQGARLSSIARDPITHYMLTRDRVRDCADDFDVLHFHIDQLHFPLFKALANRTVTTLHGRQDLADLQALYVGFSIDAIRRRSFQYGYGYGHGGAGVIGIILIVIVVLLLMGRL